MTRRLIYGRYTSSGNRALAKWVALRIPYVDASPAEPFGSCECVGVEQDRRLIAGVVFHAWEPASQTLMVSMAATTPMWARPDTILEILKVPFEMIAARKIYTMIRSDNVRVIKFNRHLGFREEGRLSEHYGRGLHGYVLGFKLKHYVGLKRRLAGRKMRTDYKVEGAQTTSAHAAALGPHHNEKLNEHFDGRGERQQSAAAA